LQAAGRIVTLLGLAALIGGMLFFSIVMAPLAFTDLAPPIAGPFIRQAFPLLYAYILVTAALAAGGFLARRRRLEAAVLLIIVAVTCWLWFWQLPQLDALRLAGNAAGFNRGHELSVWIFGAELLAAVGVLVRMA
jgi:hypothetical protein